MFVFGQSVFIDCFPCSLERARRAHHRSSHFDSIFETSTVRRALDEWMFQLLRQLILEWLRQYANRVSDADAQLYSSKTSVVGARISRNEREKKVFCVQTMAHRHHRGACGWIGGRKHNAHRKFINFKSFKLREISHCINIISFTLPLPCHRHSCASSHLLLPLLQLIARESYSYDFRLVIKMYTTLVVQVVHGDGRDNVYTLHCSLAYIYFGFILTACHVLDTTNVQMYSLCSCSDIEKSKYLKNWNGTLSTALLLPFTHICELHHSDNDELRKRMHVVNEAQGVQYEWTSTKTQSLLIT